MKNENNDLFNKLDAAKAGCSSNDNCVGLVDQRTEGQHLHNVFTLCNEPLIIKNSTTGSIFYKKGKIAIYNT